MILNLHDPLMDAHRAAVSAARDELLKHYAHDEFELIISDGPLDRAPLFAVYYLQFSVWGLDADAWDMEFDVRPYERAVFPFLSTCNRVRLEWDGKRLEVWRQTSADTARSTA